MCPFNMHEYMFFFYKYSREMPLGPLGGARLREFWP